MYIEKMPMVLCWSTEGEPVMDAVQNSYRTFLYKKLGQLLAMAPDLKQAEDIKQRLFELPDSAFLRIIEAPEVTYRLIWTERHKVEDSILFLTRAVTAEEARLGKKVSVQLPLWTALGDMVLEENKPVMYAPFETVETMPVDYRSPFASQISLEGQHLDNPVFREDLNADELKVVKERFIAAMEGIEKSGGLILTFCNEFNKVLIFQRDPDLPGEFTSGSSAQYIGRSILSNPHTEKVDEVLIAEGIVHEAIHSILYMQEIQEKWVNRPEYYSTEKIFISPWTGNRLPLRPFLQACFVWYGLLNFWCLALEKKVLNTSKVQARIEQAARGFLVPNLTEQLTSYKEGISSVILETVYEMEKNVKYVFQEILTQ